MVQTVQADCFFPVSYDDTGRLIQCVFVEQVFRGVDYYTRLGCIQRAMDSWRSKQGLSQSGGRALGAEIPLTSVDQWAGLAESVVFGDVNKLPIGYFRVPLANNIDSNNPLGASVYSRAVSKIREADRRYSRLNWEYEAKKQRCMCRKPSCRTILTEPVRCRKARERLYRKLKYRQEPGQASAGYLQSGYP